MRTGSVHLLRTFLIVFICRQLVMAYLPPQLCSQTWCWSNVNGESLSEVLLLHQQSWAGGLQLADYKVENLMERHANFTVYWAAHDWTVDKHLTQCYCCIRSPFCWTGCLCPLSIETYQLKFNIAATVRAQLVSQNVTSLSGWSWVKFHGFNMCIPLECSVLVEDIYLLFDM